MKIQFWPKDYFNQPIRELVISEPVAGTAKVVWQAPRGAYRVKLYARQHATDWPTLDGLSSGTLDPAYLVADQVLPSLDIRVGSGFIADTTSSLWQNAGYTAGQTLRAIAVPYGEYGWTGARITQSRVMNNSVSACLVWTSSFMDNHLGDGMPPGDNGSSLWWSVSLGTPVGGISNGAHDIVVERINQFNAWEQANNTDFRDNVTTTNGTNGSFDNAATCNKIVASMTPYLIRNPQVTAEKMHLGFAVKLVPNGGGSAVDMFVHHSWVDAL